MTIIRYVSVGELVEVPTEGFLLFNRFNKKSIKLDEPPGREWSILIRSTSLAKKLKYNHKISAQNDKFSKVTFFFLNMTFFKFLNGNN